MGRKAKIITLSPEAIIDLKKGYKGGSSHRFRQRCHLILLKSEGLTSAQIASLLGITIQPVNNWVCRYQANGIDGLQTLQGQGRRAILTEARDAEKVKAAIRNERQRLKLAKAGLEEDLGKRFSLRTLKRFLKNSTALGNVSG
jgi:transposase